jgi:hypothetical protein
MRPTPIEGKHFADTRDTAAPQFAEASCTIAEICSITGQSEQSAARILRHNVAMTDHTVRKYTAHLEAQEISV